ncbi:MAG: ATP-binding protein [Terriglobales bacterium]
MTESSLSSENPQSASHFSTGKVELKLSVSLSADQKAVDQVVRSVMEVVRDTKCSPGREDDVELALAEALANAVVHGAKNDASKTVECDVACNERGSLLIVVRDPGPGFNPAKIADPCAGDNIFSDHGRGIFLINQLMDEVQFHKNGTEIRMIKK